VLQDPYFTRRAVADRTMGLQTCGVPPCNDRELNARAPQAFPVFEKRLVQGLSAVRASQDQHDRPRRIELKKALGFALTKLLSGSEDG
jgi:hypothetical protein